MNVYFFPLLLSPPSLAHFLFFSPSTRYLPFPSIDLPLLFSSPLPLFFSFISSSPLLSSPPPLFFSPLRPFPLLSIPNYLVFSPPLRASVLQCQSVEGSIGAAAEEDSGRRETHLECIRYRIPGCVECWVILMWQSLSLPHTRSSSVTFTISLYLFPTYPPLSYRHQSTAIPDTCQTHCNLSLPYHSLPYPTSSYRSCSLLTLTAMEMPYASQ
jgi:hypothetical protein